MIVIGKILKVTFLLSLAIYVITSLMAAPLPDKNEIIDEIVKSEPIQQEVEHEDIALKFDKVEYTINPLYEYSFYGLVVSAHNTKNFSDVSHYDDPANTQDLCIIWGKNITDETYKKVSYESGDFTCFVKWNTQLDPPFVTNQLANNHIIPASENISKQIQKIRIGDQIHISGKLVNYSVKDNQGNSLFTRPTSTNRDDAGNGACEVVYVEKAEIIKQGAREFYTIRTAALWTAVLSLGISLAIFFLAHKPGVY